MSALQRRKGEVVSESFMEDAKVVNMLKNKLLDVDYYIKDGKLYKKLNNGMFRALVKQDKRPEYHHYFLRDDEKRKLTINANKLDKLTYGIQ